MTTCASPPSVLASLSFLFLYFILLRKGRTLPHQYVTSPGAAWRGTHCCSGVVMTSHSGAGSPHEEVSLY
jgi:hypothetical protein